MPYSSNAELPKSVKDALPAKAQSVFRNVVNSVLADGKSEERAFASAWGALENQGWSKDSEGNWRKVEKFSTLVKFVDFNTEKRQVFGWASVANEEDGSVVVDHQGDVIKIEELEKASYAFVKNSRKAGEMHARIGVGTLIESMVFTKEKQKLLKIPEGTMPEGWWVGFEVEQQVFDKIKDGTYKAFSIGGTGKRKVIED